VSAAQERDEVLAAHVAARVRQQRSEPLVARPSQLERVMGEPHYDDTIPLAASARFTALARAPIFDDHNVSPTAARD